jgi:D-beta-D-heptose 7-phosphate kinase/D-beta-D-heptose 1-phosphate adenosyltransferase
MPSRRPATAPSSKPPSGYPAALASLRGRRLAVVGDVILDRYLLGHVTRISPEAPVPVLDVGEEKSALGGAANVAKNLTDLESRVTLVSAVGADEWGGVFRMTLRGEPRITPRILNVLERTTVKTRIMAGGQQLVRIDRETVRPLAPADERALFKAVGLSQIEALVLSDYNKGVFLGGLAPKLIRAAKARKIPVIGDVKPGNMMKMAGATVLAPNEKEAREAARLLGIHGASLEKLGEGLRKKLRLSALVITRGAQGMMIFTGSAKPLTIPALAREVYDVTGAGDTVTALLALGLAGAWSLPDACRLAAAGAGIVVGKLGCASPAPAELAAALAF